MKTNIFYSLLKSLHVAFLKLKFKKKGVRFIGYSVIDNRCQFEGFNSVGKNNKLLGCFFGRGSYTGTSVQFYQVQIGRFCSIASNVKNIVGRHPTSVFVSTHPAFFSTGKAAGFTFSTKNKFREKVPVNDDFLVVIGNDVWIGENVTIMDNVIIGDGAIIGANSLVTKNIMPYSINWGIPARPVRYRFDKDTITFLQHNKWWDRDLEWIKENHDLFENIELYIRHVNEKDEMWANK
jgi:acetyltransferase-like isoleucine patch superfamily enzyme